MTPERRRELAEKLAKEITFQLDAEAFRSQIAQAFLELEREIREECAKVCEDLPLPADYYDAGERCAAAIRAELKGEGE